MIWECYLAPKWSGNVTFVFGGHTSSGSVPFPFTGVTSFALGWTKPRDLLLGTANDGSTVSRYGNCSLLKTTEEAEVKDSL